MSEHLKIEPWSDDCRKSWFMQQWYTPEQLQQLYEWEQKSGRKAFITQEGEDNWCAWHIEDVDKTIDLVSQKTRKDVEAWMTRKQYEYETI